MKLTDINPFYAARRKRTAVVPAPQHEVSQPCYARLPLAPRNTSPVPHLTSLYHFHRAGDYGDRSYPGNCGGNLIKDLLTYFRPGLVYDPMSGSGTCADVCRELKIPCLSFDIHQGFDACDPQGFGTEEAFDFIWAHPAYWRQKPYADDPRDLSPYHTKRLAFAVGLRQCCTDIIRFSHGASSSRKVYRSSFIPGLHDTCMVFERPSATSQRGDAI
ncbi:MAG: hypothetical protein FD138_893 [Planctomycetota bacterium]|nr:MAG: hypothetical protein FD138_893 [Planctomycetota bacterium]